MAIKIKQIKKDTCVVLSYDTEWVETFQLSDLYASVWFNHEDVPALVKELNKYYEKTGGE